MVAASANSSPMLGVDDLRLQAFLGKVIPVSLDAALALRDVESTFSLLIVGNDRASAALESTINSFLQHYTPSRLLVRISVEEDPKTPVLLSAAIVPQLRVYVEGQEHRRHRGTIQYESLFSFLGVQR